jgi:hypothetical protein
MYGGSGITPLSFIIAAGSLSSDSTKHSPIALRPTSFNKMLFPTVNSVPSFMNGRNKVRHTLGVADGATNKTSTRPPVFFFPVNLALLTSV